jgi:hypothetical protein
MIGEDDWREGELKKNYHEKVKVAQPRNLATYFKNIFLPASKSQC